MSEEEVTPAFALNTSTADEGLAALYDTYGALAFGLAQRVLGDIQLASEAVLQGLPHARTAKTGIGSPLGRVLAEVHVAALALASPRPAPDLEPDSVVEWARLQRERVQAALGSLARERRTVVRRPANHSQPCGVHGDGR